jgi:metal-responsive CopG/Arc/MetJ family transcriptional regulator
LKSVSIATITAISIGVIMRTIQLTIDEDLVREVDRIVQSQGTTRSAFIRRLLRNALLEIKEAELDRKHREGYEKYPVTPEEFSIPDADQVWGQR